MDEVEFDTVRQGQVASLIRADISGYIEAQKDTAITRLIDDYRDGTLTSEKCWGAVGALFALRSLENALQRDIRMGRNGRRDTAGREEPD